MIEFAPRSRLRSYLEQGYHLIPGYEPGENDYAVLVEKRDVALSEDEANKLYAMFGIRRHVFHRNRVAACMAPRKARVGV